HRAPPPADPRRHHRLSRASALEPIRVGRVTMTPLPLLRTEAHERASLIEVDRMTVDLDLTVSERTFTSRAVTEFTCREPGAGTWVDFRPQQAHEVTLNGQPIDLDSGVEGPARGRIPLTDLAEH